MTSCFNFFRVKEGIVAMPTQLTVTIAGHTFLATQDDLTALFWLDGGLENGPLKTPFEDLDTLRSWAARFHTDQAFLEAIECDDFSLESGVEQSGTATAWHEIIREFTDSLVAAHRAGYQASLIDMGLSVDKGLIQRSGHRDDYWQTADTLVTAMKERLQNE
jgi:hypothetical protein